MNITKLVYCFYERGVLHYMYNIHVHYTCTMMHTYMYCVPVAAEELFTDFTTNTRVHCGNDSISKWYCGL